MTDTDLAIVGAGPAGLAAAELAAAHGIAVTVIDAQPRPGGQIYRQPPQAFEVSNWLGAKLYTRGKRLLERVAADAQIDWRARTTVLGLAGAAPGDGAGAHALTLDGPRGIETLSARCVLVAPGCYDLPVIFPGWTLPGVMAAGGIQAFIKSQQLVPGQNFVFAGTHPLQLIVADQVRAAGGTVAGVFFAQPFSRVLRAALAPGGLWSGRRQLAFIAGVWLRLRRAGVPVRFGETVVRAAGDERLEQVEIAAVDAGREIQMQYLRRVKCDRLGLCFGFLAQSELARQRGATTRFSAARGGWIIEHDEWQRSSVPGLFVAGEITGIGGAEVAMAEGRVAAAGILRALGAVEAGPAARLAAPARAGLRPLQAFARKLAALADPGAELLLQLMADDAVLCRCEDIEVGQFSQTFGEAARFATANAAKLFSRTGMGWCQGRYCNYAMTLLLARQYQRPPGQIGPFTARFPAHPVRIGQLLDGRLGFEDADRQPETREDLDRQRALHAPGLDDARR